ncbi:MAG: glycosyltransferase family 4 protein [Anaerolineae bacterium]
MRILIVNYEFPPIGAGGGKASQKIAESLVEMGHTVRVVTARPTQIYGLSGNLSLLAGLAFWVYLAYAKLSWGEDISNHGFTILGTLLLLIGFILRHTALTWELTSPIRGLKPLEFINGVEVQRVPVARRRQDYASIWEMGTFVASAMGHCLRAVREFRPDVAHIFFAIPDGPIGWLLKRTRGLPYIISLRGADVPTDEVKRFAAAYRVLRPVFRGLLRDADAVVAVSNGLRSHALQSAPVPIKVIPNAIDLSLFTPPPEKPSGEVARLLYVGRLVASKTPEVLIEAIARLAAMETPPFVLELDGDGAQRSLLEQMVIERNLSRHVVFSGWVGHPDLVAHYRRAYLFVTAMTWEGMPNTVLEAMACGLPVVGTDAPGMNQLVSDGVNGYLVPLKDAAALADRIRRLLTDPHERARMGRESRKIAAHHFAWDVITRQYVQIYERVAQRSVKRKA